MKTDLHIFKTDEDRDIAFREVMKANLGKATNLEFKIKKSAFVCKTDEENKLVQYTSMDSLYSRQLSDLDDERTTALFHFEPTEEEYLLVVKMWTVRRGVF